jgi:hypothetical protein
VDENNGELTQNPPLPGHPCRDGVLALDAAASAGGSGQGQGSGRETIFWFAFAT